ncbi:MAG TPA: 2OG-Fe(II) oxygenase family protein [Micropepsaceae bacterium]|nr:2OG-Fe(II) oxygenase family protein [Micropepsaceae bacterium]
MLQLSPALRPDVSLALNPKLDRAALAAEYSRRGRIHISDVLTAPSADRIHACLKDETPYSLCLNLGGTARALRDLSPQERQDCTLAAWREVGLTGFQFLFDQHQVSLNGEPYPNPTHYWAKVTKFLNGPDFLALGRAITGLADIAFVDAQATLYRPGHFLTAHDDNVPGTKRLAAYVLSFTPVWRPEWGGTIQFVDGANQIEGGYMPGFNTLKIFRVPMSHYVSVVAPYAGAPRYSITGWMRAR